TTPANSRRRGAIIAGSAPGATTWTTPGTSIRARASKCSGKNSSASSANGSQRRNAIWRISGPWTASGRRSRPSAAAPPRRSGRSSRGPSIAWRRNWDWAGPTMIERDSPVTLQADQRRRWGRGERVPVETYLEQHPGLGDDPVAVLDLILGEVILREEAGGRPRPDESPRRFPPLEAPLRLQFEVHQALEDAPLSDLASLASRTDPVKLRSAFPSETIDPPQGTLPGYEILEELGRGGMGV